MADGTIRVGTKIDFSGVKADIKAFEKELATIQKEADKLNAREKEVTGRYNEEREYDKQFPAEMSHREQIDEKYAKQLDPIIKDRETLNQKAQEYNALLEQANAKLQEQSAIAQANKELSSAAKGGGALDKIRTEEQYQSLLAKTQARMARIEASAEQIAAKHGVSKAQLLSTNAEYQKLSDLLSQLNSKQGQFGKTAEKTMKKAQKSADNFGKTIKDTIKQFGKMALAMVGIRGAFTAMRRATNAYLESNVELKSQMESLWNVAGQAIGPVIEWLIKGISTLVVWVNTLVEALFGVNLIAKANAAALKKQASAAKSASSASLAGFDEMNKLSDSSGGGGSDSTGLFDESLAGDIPKFMEDIKKKIQEGDWFGAGSTLGQSLMDGIMSIDWNNVGLKVGEFLGNAANFVIGFTLEIDPLELFKTLVEFTNGLAEGITKKIKEIDWYSVGKKVMEIFLKGLLVYLATTDPLVGTLLLLFTPTGQETLRVVTDLINTILASLTEVILGASTRLGQIGIEIVGAMLTTNPIEALLGAMFAVENFLGTITSGAFKLIGTIIGALLKAVVDLVTTAWGVGKKIWESIKGFFTDGIDWGDTPGEIIQGLKDGIVKALKHIWTWIKENIWYPFRDGFKEAFDINSPSKKMEEFGGFIISGLFNGITNGINKIKTACQTIWTTIKGVFSSVGTWFQTTFSNAWQKVKDVFSKGGKIFDGIKEGISSTFKTIVNGLIDGINRIIRTPFNAINSMLNTIRSQKILGAQPFLNLWSYNPLSIPQIPKLAIGGIVNRPGRGVPAIIGEAGAEAVLPLENNTEWMDILADKIGGNVTIPIYLGGKKIAEYVVDLQKKKAFAMNGA